MFDPFVNKLVFKSFILDCPACPKCGSTKALIAPTQNTHAASSRCSNCDKFYRWLGKHELRRLLRFAGLLEEPSPQTHHPEQQAAPQAAVAADNTDCPFDAE
jgi:hypothetical protein